MSLGCKMELAWKNKQMFQNKLLLFSHYFYIISGKSFVTKFKGYIVIMISCFSCQAVSDLKCIWCCTTRDAVIVQKLWEQLRKPQIVLILLVMACRDTWSCRLFYWHLCTMGHLLLPSSIKMEWPIKDAQKSGTTIEMIMWSVWLNFNFFIYNMKFHSPKIYSL